MVKYTQEIQQAVASKNLRKQAHEEALMRHLVTELQSTERQVLRESDQTRKDNSSDLQKRLNDKRAALENYYRDQCDMINEEIKDIQREQSVSQKAKVEVSKRAV